MRKTLDESEPSVKSWTALCLTLNHRRARVNRFTNVKVVNNLIMGPFSMSLGETSVAVYKLCK